MGRTTTVHGTIFNNPTALPPDWKSRKSRLLPTDCILWFHHVQWPQHYVSSHTESLCMLFDSWPLTLGTVKEARRRRKGSSDRYQTQRHRHGSQVCRTQTMTDSLWYHAGLLYDHGTISPSTLLEYPCFIFYPLCYEGGFGVRGICSWQILRCLTVRFSRVS